jgi:DNA modification methylase
VNTLYYGDNLEVLRSRVRDATIDLCYIDPPFNSKRNYNQIYNNIGSEDKAQAQAFVDTWEWDDVANQGLQQVLGNYEGRFTAQSIELIKGLRNVLSEGSLLAYLISIALRAVEIHRVLKPTGSFYFHCDPTASHYLKLVLDTIFLPNGGEYVNEIAWCYASGGVSKSYFAKKHDIIFFYAKSPEYQFNTQYRPYTAGTLQRGLTKVKTDMNPDYELRSEGAVMSDWWPDITPLLSPTMKERMGYPTQKPEALLERIIKAGSNEGDMILDAYCGCGTTVAVAERLKREWIGIDITYQSISLVLRRLEGQYGREVIDAITLDGIPRDMESAVALAHKKDDRVRKEFEKWALLTYTNNRARVNEKKGADKGIDGIAYFQTAKTENAKIIFQVKSGGVSRGDIATLRGDMGRENAELAILITLEPPTAPMVREAKAVGQYHHDLMGRSYDRIGIATIEEILDGKRLDIPMSLEVLRAAQRAVEDKQMTLAPVAEAAPIRAPRKEKPTHGIDYRSKKITRKKGG